MSIDNRYRKPYGRPPKEKIARHYFNHKLISPKVEDMADDWQELKREITHALIAIALILAGLVFVGVVTHL